MQVSSHVMEIAASSSTDGLGKSQSVTDEEENASSHAAVFRATSEDEDKSLDAQTSSYKRRQHQQRSPPSSAASSVLPVVQPTSAPPTVVSRRLGRGPPPSAYGATDTGITSLSSHSLSGGEASAASSRSHLPLQSKTSLYRRQASAASSVSEHVPEEAFSHSHVRDGSSLGRAKSVSSVSSVNSTSSMEAVPFRAAPLGNVRMGFGGYARARIAQARSNIGSSDQDNRQSEPPNSAPHFGGRAHTDVSQSTNDTWNDEANPLQTDEASASTGIPVTAPSARQRILPKGPSDDWQYRNAPGMGVRTRGVLHTIAATRPSQQLRPGIPTLFAAQGDAVEGGESDESSHQHPQVKMSIRNKLAKRAGKLGLKPLTTVPGFGSSISNSTPAGRGQEDIGEGSSLSGQASVPALRITNEPSFRTSKSYFSGPMPSIGNLTDNDVILATSSVTNAPLIVTKNPPGPPGSGPPPSPGLVGLSHYALPSPSQARISPQEQSQEALEYIDPLNERVDEANSTSSSSQRPNLLHRPDSINSGFSGALGGGSNRSSTNLNIRPSSRGTPPSTSPLLTPAQMIQMEVRAGIATVPSEPSGAGPRPENEADSGSAAGRRPMSASVSTQTTVRPSLPIGPQRWSSGALSTKNGSSPSGPFRPGFLRSITTESLGKRSSLSKDEGRRRKADVAHSLRTRSGSASPRSPSSSSMVGGTSPSLLRLEVSHATQQTSQSDSQSRSMRPSQSLPTENIAMMDTPDSEESRLGDPGRQDGPKDNAEVEMKASRDVLPKKPAVSRINSGTAPSDLPSTAVTSTDSSISSVEMTKLRPTSIGVTNHPAMSRDPQVTTTELGQPSSVASAAANTRERGRSNANRSARLRDDFWFGELIGEGSYSTVVEAWDLVPLREKGIHVPTQGEGDASNALAAIAGKAGQGQQRAKLTQSGAKAYAVKVLDKVHILKEKKQKYVNVEKEALSLLTRHPGVITLYWTFQDRDSLYFVLEMAPKGELLSVIKKLGSLSERCAKFYAAQLVQTIGDVHKAGVWHRDIKPENVLLAADMRIRVADFGSAKVIRQQSKEQGGEQSSSNVRPSSFVGTAEYVSPELLTDKNVSEASDFWAFGCVLYQMLCGRPPFKGASEYQTFQKIMRRDFDFQAGFPDAAKDLIDRLLSLNPSERPMLDAIKSHKFFEGIQWSTIWTCDVPALETGLYKRPIVESRSVSSKASEERLTSNNEDDGMDSASGAERETDEGGRADEDAFSLQDSVFKSGIGDERDQIGMTGDDADDDDSSISDSQASPFRKRGFSTGASTTDRLLAQVNSTTRRGSQLLGKVTSLASNADGSDENVHSGSNGPHRESGSRVAAAYGGPEMTSMADMSAITSWAALLLPQESLLYACPVLHRNGGGLLRSSTKKRQLLLTDFPRLLCVKETNDQLKVKSEVILALPKMFASASNATTTANTQTSAGVDHIAGLDDNAINHGGAASSIAAPSFMRRQSSAGPLLPGSPTMINEPTSQNAARVQSMEASPIRRLSNTGMSLLRRQLSQSNIIPSSSSSGGTHGESQQQQNPSGSAQMQTHSQRSSFSVPWSSAAQPQQTSSNSFGLPVAQGTLGSSSSSSFMDVAQASPNVMTSVESKSIRMFLIQTPARSYLYEDPTGDASHWIKSIKMAARRHGAILPST